MHRHMCSSVCPHIPVHKEQTLVLVLPVGKQVRLSFTCYLVVVVDDWCISQSSLEEQSLESKCVRVHVCMHMCGIY